MCRDSNNHNNYNHDNGCSRPQLQLEQQQQQQQLPEASPDDDSNYRKEFLLGDGLGHTDASSSSLIYTQPRASVNPEASSFSHMEKKKKKNNNIMTSKNNNNHHTCLSDCLFSIFLTGPPGAGKTTQLQLLQEYFAKYCQHVSICQNKALKREAKESRAQFKKYSKKPHKQALLTALSEQGKLCCSQMVRRKLYALHQSKHKNSSSNKRSPMVWVYSRGPSSVEQAKYLHEYHNVVPDLYIVLEVKSIDHLIDRVVHRRVDPVTQRTYNLKHDQLDEQLRERLVSRRCDDERYFMNRMANYTNRMEPVISYYQKLNHYHQKKTSHHTSTTVNNASVLSSTSHNRVEIVRLDATRSPEEVWKDIESKIHQIMQRRKFSLKVQNHCNGNRPTKKNVMVSDVASCCDYHSTSMMDGTEQFNKTISITTANETDEDKYYFFREKHELTITTEATTLANSTIIDNGKCIGTTTAPVVGPPSVTESCAPPSPSFTHLTPVSV